MQPALPTRRKVCQNCAAAKRRCPISWPRCTRCVAKGLECIYDLEPLPGGPAPGFTSPGAARWRGPDRASATPLHCLLERLSRREPQSWDSTKRLRLRSDPTGVAYIIWALNQATVLAAAGTVSPFIHPRRQSYQAIGSIVAEVIAAIRRPDGVRPTDATFTDLLHVELATKPLLEDVLDMAQALLLYLAAFLCSNQSPPPEQQYESSAIESWFRSLSTWIELLEQQACRLGVVRGLSPWQAWLLGESTRRTILIADILTCIFSGKKYELPALKLRIEALPFDGRARLWQAESPQAWSAAAGVRRGCDVQTQLVSFHEFGSSRPEVSLDAGGDLFMAIVLVAHNGIDETADIQDDDGDDDDEDFRM